MEDKITRYIKCHKTITNKHHPKMVENNRSFRADVDILSDDGTRFTMFLRRLSEFNEDFSVGLRLNSPNSLHSQPLVLLRFQGPHSGQSKQRTMSDIHNSYHIHIYTEEDYNNNRFKANFKEKADNFTSMNEAIVEFLDYCNIEDPYKIFSEERASVRQLKLDIDELTK